MSGILNAYLITFGWALVGSIAMGCGVIIMLRLFDWSTPNVDEWALIKSGNIPMALILSSMILALGIVVASVVSP